MARTLLNTIETTVVEYESGHGSFVEKAFISAPDSVIQNRAKVSNSLKCIMGNERIHINSLTKIPNEVGPAGEDVWEPDNGDSRIRFFGPVTSIFNSNGTHPTIGLSKGVEITFYGTGLNLLHVLHAATIQFSITVDGVLATPYTSAGASLVLAARNYNLRNVEKIVSNLTLGWHTVKLIGTADATAVEGFEIINEASQITIPSGVCYSKGEKFDVAAALLNYKTGFENVADVNVGTRGGRSVIAVDKADGLVKKYFTKTDDQITIGNPTELVTNGTFDTDTDWVKTGSTTIGSGTATTPNSSSELRQTLTTVIGNKYTVFYEITATSNNGGTVIVDGVNVSGDVFVGLGSVSFTATLTSTPLRFQGSGSSSSATWDNVSAKETAYNHLALGATDHTEEAPYRVINFSEFERNRADDFSNVGTANASFTLDDGTTTLVSNGCSKNSSFSGEIGMSFANPSDFTITFVGTGLDVRFLTGAGSNGTFPVTVNGISVGSLTFNSDSKNFYKVCSGLPYGTHTVKITDGSTASNITVNDFKLYGPKKPTLPAGAVELGEYNIMADFVANTVEGVDTIATGVLRKSPVREVKYEGTSWIVDAVQPGNYIMALGTRSNGASGDSCSLTFFGTGFEYRSVTDGSMSNNITLEIDGSLATAANFPTATYNAYGLHTYNDATATIDTSDAGNERGGLTVSGLPLGVHTLKLTTNTTARLRIGAFDIITPTHTPHTTFGSRSIKDLRNFDADKSNNKIVKEKDSYCYKEGNVSEILSSKNISQVINNATGQWIVYLEDPMVSDNYSGQGSALTTSRFSSIYVKQKHRFRLNCQTSSGVYDDWGFDARVFGKLEKDELEE